MKQRHPTSTLRLAAGAAILTLALLGLLGMASARPSEANGPDAQITMLANPNLGVILNLVATPTPAPFDLTGVLIDPNLNVRPFITVPPLLAVPTVIVTPEPCGQAITLGKAVNGTLSGGGQRCEHTFAGRAGQTVNIAMRRTGGSIDPLIELRGPDGYRIASDDDSDGRLNSALRGYTLEQSGTYTVVARSFDPAASGAYQLSVGAGRPSQPAGAALPGADEVVCTGALDYGKKVEGQVPFPGAECWYTFDGARGDTVALYLKALDDGPLPEMQLLDARGRIVPGSETQPDDSSLVTSGLLLPANGSYTIVLADTSDTGTTPFELSIVRQDPCKDVASYGPLRFEISDDNPVCTVALLDPIAYYSTTTVRPVSGDIQPLVQFYGPNGELLEEYVSDGTSHRTPLNTWTVVIQGLDGTTGVIDLQISSGAQYLLTTEFCGGSISSGRFIRDTLGLFGPTCSYTFDGNAGDIVTIRMTRQGGASNELDTYLTLLDPDDNPETSDDDGGLPPTNSLIKNYELQTTGRYTIAAGSYNDATTGPFYLTFWQRSP